MSFKVAVSAPGKVLLAGGYLVLDRDHTGLVFGLDARIHVHVEATTPGGGLAHSEITVQSPQFRDASWRYECRKGEMNGGVEVTQIKGDSTALQPRNKFVETALSYALTYVSTISDAKIHSASITILADTDYYSHGGSSKSESSLTGRRFLNFNVPLSEAHKTGLGSSAALVTAFVAAVLAHYLPPDLISLTTDTGRAYLHNLAQAAHCAAQGKVGSGFDIAAAVYGSCLYRRFSPSILEESGDVGSKEFSSYLKSVVEDQKSPKRWDLQIDRSLAVLPTGLRLVMCDVDCGSETVGMVRKVLTWRKDNPQEAMLLWGNLQKGNDELAEELKGLAQGTRKPSNDYENLSRVLLAIRSLIRELSTKTGVPIEPKVQTDLLDTCCQLPGVVGGVVPGAGGFDAIALLVEDREEIIKSLSYLLDSYRVDAQQEDGASIGKVRLLGVKQDTQGFKMEDPLQYKEWIK